jgi:hypothetical protein
LGDGFLGDATLGARAADFRLQFGILEGGLLGLPIAVSAKLSIGQVVFVDRLAVKFPGHEGCDLWQGVEPFGDLFAFFAILEALVDLLGNGMRQPCYFTLSRHKKVFFLGLLTFIDLY